MVLIFSFDVICNNDISANDNSIYVKFDLASDLWKQFNLASKLQFDPQDTVDWGRKWLNDFNDGKIQLVSFDQSINSDTIDVKMDRSVLEEKSYFKKLGFSFSS